MYVEDVEDRIINFDVHSTVYRFYVEDVEDIKMYGIYFRRKIRTETNPGLSWGRR